MAEVNLGRVKGEPFTYDDFTEEQLAALKGANGVSPTISTSKVNKTTTVSITDIEGTKTFQVLDGNDGNNGVSISAITQTLSTEDNAMSPIEISLSDGTTSTVYVKNGKKGSEGVSITSAIQTTSSTQSGGKNTVTFKDSNGNNVGSVDIYNGQKGENATTTNIATESTNGLMSSTDKSKLDGIEIGAQKNTITGVKGSSESSYRTGNVNITPANIGLGNVGNFKAVSTVASQGLTDTEKSNARSNIGAGTSSFSGSYNDLKNKPTIPSVGNGTITIKQAGTTKGTFTTNQSGNTTIELTDNNTTYSNFVKSGSGAKAGLVPAPPTTAGTTKYLREDGTWTVPPNDNTKNTAGATNTSSKIFLVGSTSQAASPQTYSHDTAYVGTDGCLYSNSTRVINEVISSSEPSGQINGDYWLKEY